MTQNLIKLLLCLFQVVLIAGTSLMYVYVRTLKTDRVYYELLSYIYGLILVFCEVMSSIYIFILMQTRVQITSLNMVYRYIRDNCYKEYYALVIINLGFLMTSCIIGLTDTRALSFSESSSYHFVASFYIQCCLYVLFSQDLLQRRALVPNEQIFETEGVFRCAYEVLYYIISLLVVISYFLVVKFEMMDPVISTVSQLIVFTMVYMLYSITKIGILVKFFLVVTIARLLYAMSQNLKGNITTEDKAIQIAVAVLASLLLIRIVDQIRKGFIKARAHYRIQDNNVPVDVLAALNLLPERDPIDYGRLNQVNHLNEEELAALPQTAYHQNEHEELCSICDMNLLKDEITIKIGCAHTFHSECLKPWLRIRNSCPNCRRIVVERGQQEQQMNQLIIQQQ